MASVQSIGAKKNKLLRYEKIMEEFEKHDCSLIPIAVIHRKFIYPKFHISRDTLYRILNTPIQEELEKVKQPTLFDLDF